MRILMVMLMVFNSAMLLAQPQTFEVDTFQTAAGKLSITFIGHGTLMLAWRDKIIHVDPVGREADYSQLPRADLMLVTHEHGDHLDPNVLQQISQPTTKIILTAKCFQKFGQGLVMKNGDTKKIHGIKIAAVPAYNLEHRRKDGTPFHPRGEGNGYIIEYGGKRIYIAGDTENVPEMKQLRHIDIAFLPMNLPYTMTPEMVADAARAFRPKILYPYHCGETDPQRLVELLRDMKDIEIRIRQMQ